MYSLTRQIKFQASHHYVVKGLTEETNRKLFGETCKKHEHEYVLEVTVTGKLDPQTGMVMNLSDLDDILQKIAQTVQGSHLNEHIAYFSNHNPTTEVMAKYFSTEISKELQNLNNSGKANTLTGKFEGRLSKVRVYESPNLWAEFILD